MEFDDLSVHKVIAANQNIKERDNWLNKLSGELVKSRFPYDTGGSGGFDASPSNRKPRKAAVTFRHSGELFSRLMRMSNNSEYTLHMILVSAIVILVDRYTYKGTADIIVGSPIYRQEREGHFINTILPLKIHLQKDMSFKELLLQVRQTIIEADENQNYPIEILCRELNIESAGEGFPLFDIMVLVENIHDKKYISDIKTNTTFLFSRTDEYIEGVLEYNSLLYYESKIMGITDHLTNLLKVVLSDVEIRICHLEILSREEKERLLYCFNDNKADFPRDKSIYHFIEENTIRTPGQISVVIEDREVSVEEINKRANQLSRVLSASGIQVDQPVGILLNRSVEMVISILGVWKAGGAYIPLDTQYPPQRLEGILKDSETRVLITESRHIDTHLQHEYEGKMLYLDKLNHEIKQMKDHSQDLILSMNSLSYIIYTSGSTGRPKGAMVEHIGMMNHIHAKIKDLQLGARSVVAQNATHCFDISVWQFFTGLVVGGQTVIFPDNLVLQPDQFVDRLIKDNVTVLEVVPSYLSVMLDFLKTKPRHFEYLQYLLVTGEVIRPTLVNQWFEKYPAIKLVNAYGPTEAADDITHHIMSGPIETDRVPIGKSLQNFNIYIVNELKQLCPPGVTGEIWVSGVGVGRGYLKDNEKTQQAFIEDIFSSEQGVRLYKTGDLGRWLPDGAIDFLGRIDEQVKVRGYRIECGEIENVLLENQEVKEALVITREDKKKNNYLVAYLVGENQININELEDYLRRRLPDYMVPAYLVQLDNFPLNLSGKIDKKALPEPTINKVSSNLYAEPRTRTEIQLAEIWQEVLGLEQVGINDDFLNLGGNSIKGMRIVNKIQHKLQEIIHVALLFENPTIKSLAGALDSYQTGKHKRIDAGMLEKFREIIPRLSPISPPVSKNPPAVFILSPPRTGSTLLRVLLGGHSKIFATPELELLLFNTLQDRKEGLYGPFSYFAEGAIRIIMEIKGCSPEEGKAIMEKFERQNLAIYEFYGQIQQWIGEKILVDKTANYSLSLETMRRAEMYFDSPRYIHLTRHPYAVIQSYQEAKLDQVFRYNHPFTVRELAELVWLISEQNIHDFLKDIPGERKYFIKYEELVQNPVDMAADICRFLGLEFEEEMVNVYKNTEKKMTDGLYAESKMIGDVKFFQHSTINKNVADRWRQKHDEDFLGDISVQMARSLGYLMDVSSPGDTTIQLAEELEHYPLSHAQKRLWILAQFEKASTVYNIPVALVFDGELDKEALEKSVKTIIKRQNAMRTTFILVKGNPRQKIHNYTSSIHTFECVDLRGKKDRVNQTRLLVEEEAAVIFDLEKGPLVKSKLICLEDNRYLFLFTMHHIISDGWSMGLLMNEVFTLYNIYKIGNDSPLALLPLQYKDFAVWQNSEKQEKAFNNIAAYWWKQFDEIPILDLPVDYPRPLEQDFEGSTIDFDLDIEATKVLNRLARSEGGTLFMILLAIYTIFLSKVSSQEDIIVGSPTTGRKHRDLEGLIGMFVNTLALRSFPSGGKTFHEFFKEVKEIVLKAFENQDYPFEVLVENVEMERDVSRNPLFDALIVLQDIFKFPGGKLEPVMEGVMIKSYPHENKTSKFDLTLFINVNEEKLDFVFEYRTHLFKKETMGRFTSCFLKILSEVLENPGIKITQIEIISGEEKSKILYEFNNTNAGFPGNKTIYDLFREQVKKNSSNIALSEAWHAHHITYGKLDQQAGKLAGLLGVKGGKTEAVAAIMLERSIEMIVGIFAILKSGYAYLPIDPGYPLQRIKYILADSNASFLVTSHAFATTIVEKINVVKDIIYLEKNLLIDQSGLYEITNEPDVLPAEHRVTGTKLAYVIYTSGSTGKPKGVVIEHRAVINRLNWMQKAYPINQQDVILQKTPIIFDVSVWELFWWSFQGASLCLLAPGEEKIPEAIINAVEKKKVTTMHFVPSMLNVFLLYLGDLETNYHRRLAALHQVFSSGEELAPHQV